MSQTQDGLLGTLNLRLTAVRPSVSHCLVELGSFCSEPCSPSPGLFVDI